jgi:predicted HicB family RNase H-like nuclease
MASDVKEKLIRFPPELFALLGDAAHDQRESQNGFVVEAVRERIARLEKSKKRPPRSL